MSVPCCGSWSCAALRMCVQCCRHTRVPCCVTAVLVLESKIESPGLELCCAMCNRYFTRNTDKEIMEHASD